jgi:hypothetical protein
LATILAALDWKDTPAPEIQIHHLEYAIRIAERWRMSAHRALELVGSTGNSNLKERVITQIAQYGSKGATLRDINTGMRDKKARDIEPVIEELVDLGEIKPDAVAPGKRGGRPTVRYQLVKG